MVITTDPVTFDENYVGTAAVSVQGYDQYGATITCTPVWTDNSAGTTYINLVPGNPATAQLSADGSQIAGGFTITATDGTVFDTATLTITPIGAGVTPYDIACHKVGTTDILIDWTTGTGPFDVQRI